MFVTALNRRNSHRILTDDLIARWPFNDNYNDVVGSNDGSVVGSGITVSHLGANFTAYGSISLAASSVWPTLIAGADRKYSIFAEVTPSGSNIAYILVKYASGVCSVNWRELLFRVINNKISFYTAFNGSATANRAYTGTTTVTGGVPARLGITYDGTLDTNDGADRVVMYLNGAVETQGTMSSTGSLSHIATNLSAPFCVGDFLKTTSSLCFNATSRGTIKDLRIYDRTLTEEEAINITAGIA